MNFDPLTLARTKLRAPWMKRRNAKTITINDAQGHILARLNKNDVPDIETVALAMESVPELLQTALRQRMELGELHRDVLMQIAEISGLRHRVKQLEATLRAYQDTYPMPEGVK